MIPSAFIKTNEHKPSSSKIHIGENWNTTISTGVIGTPSFPLEQWTIKDLWYTVLNLGKNTKSKCASKLSSPALSRVRICWSRNTGLVGSWGSWENCSFSYRKGDPHSQTCSNPPSAGLCCWQQSFLRIPCLWWWAGWRKRSASGTGGSSVQVVSGAKIPSEWVRRCTGQNDAELG